LAIGAHQLFALDQIPPHAACATSVELLRRNHADHLTGVANAVLRKLAALQQAERSGPGPLGRLPVEQWPEDPAVLASLPDALVGDVRAELGEQPRERLLALNQLAPLCTRTRPGMSPPAGQGILRQDGEWTWWEDAQAALAEVAQGRCVVQDRAQGQVVAISAARPGELVLDVCAAPGGKALAFADRGCRVIAAEVNLARLPRLRQNLGSAPLVAQDGRRPALAEGAFDVVVVDAPCSNSGVLARRPEARWRYHRGALKELARLQRSLLERSATLVRPDGKLVYSTCSVTPGENQGIAHQLTGWRILAEHRGWPDQWQGGGYAAVLVRA
jgi:16S rRNA (cytosine967-C5)-methyltransferase